jgi:hypothetical protein
MGLYLSQLCALDRCVLQKHTFPGGGLGFACLRMRIGNLLHDISSQAKDFQWKLAEEGIAADRVGCCRWFCGGHNRHVHPPLISGPALRMESGMTFHFASLLLRTGFSYTTPKNHRQFAGGFAKNFKNDQLKTAGISTLPWR